MDRNLFKAHHSRQHHPSPGVSATRRANNCDPSWHSLMVSPTTRIRMKCQWWSPPSALVRVLDWRFLPARPAECSADWRNDSFPPVGRCLDSRFASAQFVGRSAILRPSVDCAIPTTHKIVKGVRRYRQPLFKPQSFIGDIEAV
jgi:hypothetical protein